MHRHAWPSPLPGPAWQSCRVAWDHVEQRTLHGISEDLRYAILRAPAVEAVHAYMCRLAYWGDVAKTQAAAQVWLAVVKEALAAQRGRQAV